MPKRKFLIPFALVAIFGIDPILVQGLPEASSCDEGWISYPGSENCYRAFRQRGNFSSAQETCLQFNSDLVSIHSQEENEFVVELFRSKNLSYTGDQAIIGLVINTDKSLLWVDRSIPTWLNWASDRPEGTYADAHGVLIVDPDNKLEYGKWYDISFKIQAEFRAFVCKKHGSPTPQLNTENSSSSTVPSSMQTIHSNTETTTQRPAKQQCLDGWIGYFDTNICFRTFNSKTWPDAHEACRDEQAALASVHSHEQHAFLLELAQNATDIDGHHNAWIGINIYSNGESWDSATWDDGSSVEYINWAPNEPDNVHYQKCGLLVGVPDPIQMSPETYQHWVSDNCEHVRAYICEKEAEPVLVTTSTTQSQTTSILPTHQTLETSTFSILTTEPTVSPQDSKCDKENGWTTFNGSIYCYKTFSADQVPIRTVPRRPLVFEPLIDFDSANEFCVEQNAALASIHSQEENDFISSISNVPPENPAIDVLIGLVLSAHNGVSWTDQSSVDWLYWDDGQPIQKGKVNYTHGVFQNLIPEEEGVPYGKWISSTADEKAGAFVCKKLSGTTTQTLTSSPTTTDTTTPVENLFEQKIYSSKRCRKGWSSFAGSDYCYKIIYDQQDFPYAHEACTDQNAYLASIHSQEENDFITELALNGSKPEGAGLPTINDLVLIGLKTDTMEWTDESRVDYENWFHSPKSSAFNSNCVALAKNLGTETSNWYSMYCDLLFKSFVCKKHKDM